MAAPTVRYARTGDGASVAYLYAEGEGAPILGVPKFSGLPISCVQQTPSLAEFTEAFRDRAPYCYIEPRGMGLSDDLVEGTPFPQWEQDVLAVLDALGQPVHLWGFWGGCHAATAAAANRPDRVLSLTLLCPSANVLLGSPGQVLFFEQDFQVAIRWMLGMILEVDEPPGLLELTANFVRQIPESTFRRVADPVVNLAPRLKEPLEKVSAPVLVMYIPEERDNAREVAALVPGAPLVGVSGYPFNGRLGRELRAAFDEFWHSARPDHPAREASYSGARGRHSLSAREQEVARLLASGKSNREIAAALTIGEPTVATHVRHIFEKTGSMNRSQATAWAIRNGLEELQYP